MAAGKQAPPVDRKLHWNWVLKEEVDYVTPSVWSADRF